MKNIAVLVTALLCSIASSAQDKGVSFAGANWSPDGKWITFTRMDITQSKPMKIDADVYVVGSDGKNLRKVTGDAANEFNPAFAKNGRSLFFGVNNPATQAGDIFSANLDGTAQRKLTTDLSHASAPEVSRDGKWIVFNAVLTNDPKDHHPQIL